MLRFPALLLAAAVFPAAASAQPPHVQTPEEALEQDAGEYARNQGVSQEEAVRRLRAQRESVAATDRIRRTYSSRLAGIRIQHRPDFRIVVLLTGSAPVPDEVVMAGGVPVPIVFQTGAAATQEQVVAAIRTRGAAIRELVPGAEGMGHDPRTGALVIMADPDDLGGRRRAELEARIEAVAGVPVRIRMLNASHGDFGVAGGSRVEGQNPGDAHRSFCTTGFTVTDGARTGIITAAHCPDSLTYYGPGGAQTPLPFVGQWGAQFQDVQVNLGTGAERPLFYADRARTQSRPLTDARLRSATRAGETVCHRGEASGYSCSEVELTDYAPPRDLCGGYCDPVWVTVTGPSCRNGDSGGPVFAGTTALGIVKGGNYRPGGRCNFYYYMSTDYLPPGWSLLIDRAAGSVSRNASANVEASQPAAP